jgi:hypothetical protein
VSYVKAACFTQRVRAEHKESVINVRPRALRREFVFYAKAACFTQRARDERKGRVIYVRPRVLRKGLAVLCRKLD